MEKILLERLLQRVRDCVYCEKDVCPRHSEALRFLLQYHVFFLEEFSNLFIESRADPRVFIWRGEDERLQIDVVHSHVCFTYRTVGGLASTGDIMLRHLLNQSPWLEKDLEKLAPLPFEKISVSGYRQPHSDFVSGYGLGHYVAKIQIGNKEFPMFQRELYGKTEGVIARGFFIHIPGNGVFSSLPDHPDYWER